MRTTSEWSRSVYNQYLKMIKKACKIQSFTNHSNIPFTVHHGTSYINIQQIMYNGAHNVNSNEANLRD